jgi:hypothetical protein
MTTPAHLQEDDPMSGRGLWPFATILFLATTLLFLYLTLHYSTKAKQWESTRPAPSAEVGRDVPAQTGEQSTDLQETSPPPPKRPRSAWETENKAAPMANVPVFDLGQPGSTEYLEIELKTTVQWILLLYQAPLDQEVRRPEILLKGPGDKVYWGAGPLPTMSPGELGSLAIPGDFLPQGGFHLRVRGADGEDLTYLFRLIRKRHPWEEEEEEEVERG